MAKKVEKFVANYRVIIEQDKYADDSVVFSAYCPTLELADYGDTVDEALKHIKSLIKFHLECLMEEGKEIPAPDKEAAFVSNTQVTIPILKKFPQPRIAYA